MKKILLILLLICFMFSVSACMVTNQQQQIDELTSRVEILEKELGLQDDSEEENIDERIEKLEEEIAQLEEIVAKAEHDLEYYQSKFYLDQKLLELQMLMEKK